MYIIGVLLWSTIIFNRNFKYYYSNRCNHTINIINILKIIINFLINKSLIIIAFYIFLNFMGVIADESTKTLIILDN